MRLKPADIGVLVLSLGLLAWLSLSVYGNSLSAGRLVVEAAGSKWEYPLDQERSISIPGPLGDTRIEIGDGQARIIDSPCKNKLCVAMGRISQAHQWVACLPNRVIARIESGGTSEKRKIDAAAF